MFGLAEAKRNLVAAGGGLFRLPRAIGRAAAMEAILTGEPIPAPRAYELGLVSRLTEPGEVMTEEVLSKVYGWPVIVEEDRVTGSPRVVPARGT